MGREKLRGWKVSVILGIVKVTTKYKESKWLNSSAVGSGREEMAMKKERRN